MRLSDLYCCLKIIWNLVNNKNNYENDHIPVYLLNWNLVHRWRRIKKYYSFGVKFICSTFIKMQVILFQSLEENTDKSAMVTTLLNYLPLNSYLTGFDRFLIKVMNAMIWQEFSLKLELYNLFNWFCCCWLRVSKLHLKNDCNDRLKYN